MSEMRFFASQPTESASDVRVTLEIVIPFQAALGRPFCAPISLCPLMVTFGGLTPQAYRVLPLFVICHFDLGRAVSLSFLFDMVMGFLRMLPVSYSELDRVVFTISSLLKVRAFFQHLR